MPLLLDFSDPFGGANLDPSQFPTKLTPDEKAQIDDAIKELRAAWDIAHLPADEQKIADIEDLKTMIAKPEELGAAKQQVFDEVNAAYDVAVDVAMNDFAESMVMTGAQKMRAAYERMKESLDEMNNE